MASESQVPFRQTVALLLMVSLLFCEFARAPSKGGVYRMASFRLLDDDSLSHQHPTAGLLQAQTAGRRVTVESPEATTTAAGAILSPAERPSPSLAAAASAGVGAATTAVAVIRPTTAAAKRTADGDDVDSKHFNDHSDTDYGHHCPGRPVVVQTGDWSRAGQRLGNTLGMLTLALITADKMHGALELLAPGNRYYNTTRFCTSESDVATPTAIAVKHELFHCYTPCKCGLGKFHAYRNALQRFVLPHLFVSPRVNLEPNALVIHMRSGDVMRTSRGVKYWQPPLAYYKYIVETFHPTSPIYICTEIHKPADGITGGNPVVDELLKWRPDIKFPEADLKGDVATLLGARYLVQGVSSFSVTLAAMSDRLIRTYIPRQVSLQPDSKCCDCTRSGPDGAALPKEWNCGAGNGWPQPGNRSASVVQVLLPGYVCNDLMNFTHVSANMLGYDGPVCHNTFPKEAEAATVER